LKFDVLLCFINHFLFTFNIILM